MAAGNAFPLPSTVETNQRQPGWISGRRLHSNVCFQCGIFGQGCLIKSMVAQALLSRHQKMTQISTITARFRHHPKPPVAPPLLHPDLYLTKNSNPSQGNRLTAPPRLRSGAAARLPAPAAQPNASPSSAMLSTSASPPYVSCTTTLTNPDSASALSAAGQACW